MWNTLLILMLTNTKGKKGVDRILRRQHIVIKHVTGLCMEMREDNFGDMIL